MNYRQIVILIVLGLYVSFGLTLLYLSWFVSTLAESFR